MTFSTVQTRHERRTLTYLKYNWYNLPPVTAGTSIETYLGFPEPQFPLQSSHFSPLDDPVILRHCQLVLSHAAREHDALKTASIDMRHDLIMCRSVAPPNSIWTDPDLTLDGENLRT
jgi:hypothetical protein